MKKPAAILLLLVFGIATIGYFPLFKLLQLQARHEMKIRIKQGVDKRELLPIFFSRSQSPQWIRNGKELRYNHTLFDVVKTERTAQGWVYYCIHDKQESKLFSELNTWVDRQLQNENIPCGNAAKLFMQIFSWVFTSGSPSCFLPGIIRKMVNTVTLLPAFYSVFPDTESPPPDLS